MGKLITFEGGEGAGKSTLVKAVATHLQSKGHTVVSTREPGGCQLAEKIRDLLLYSTQVAPKAELLLFLAARAQHVQETILPAMKKGQIVLCDRFTESTIAYQGYGRGLDLMFLETLCHFATSSLQPDLIFYLDIDPQKGLQRGVREDRIENESMTFHAQVRAGFLHQAKKKANMVVLDGSKSVQEVQKEAFLHLETL